MGGLQEHSVEHPHRGRGVACQFGLGAAWVGGDGDGGTAARETALQFVGEKQVGKLGLRVCADRAVAAFTLEGVEANPRAETVGCAADGDDARVHRVESGHNLNVDRGWTLT